MTSHTPRGAAIRLCVVAVSALAIIGCDAPRAAEPPDVMDGASLRRLAADVVDGSPLHCVKIAILQDQTESRNGTRTELVTPAVLEIAIGLLRETCGELLVGAIRDKSNRPLERLVMPMAPEEPIRPRADGNAFDVRDAMAIYDQKVAAYDRELRQWRDAVDVRVAAFVERVDTLVAETRLANSSAVLDAIFRADVALAEPEINTSSEGSRYIVLASDAQDTTRTRMRPFRSGALLVVANGAGTLGSLASIPGVRGFEGLPAAISWIGDAERAKLNSSTLVR